MKYIFTILCCFLFAQTFAETIGDVEYHLPQTDHEWVVGNKLQGKKGNETIIYIPKGMKRQNTKEFFGVNSNKLSFSKGDVASLKEGLKTMYPSIDIDIQTLESNIDNLVYEWSGKENGKEIIHGWGRVFFDQNGTIILSYQTENLSELAKARSIWLPVLKTAKRTKKIQ